MIEVCAAAKSFVFEGRQTPALQAVDLNIAEGSFVALVGPSGCGKSTLLNMMAGLIRPSQGYIAHGGRRIESVNTGVGYMTQQDNLLPWRSALDNVMLPMVYAGVPAEQRRELGIDALQRVGLGERLHNKPNQLSGGQQQRVAVARAIINNPNLLLADEPTGALDSRTTKEVLDLFDELHREQGMTILLVTHEHDVAARAERIVHFHDGRLVDSGAGSQG